MLQVTAASLVSENKTLSHPASVDSIPTGGGQEDHVSMAPWSGRKLLSIIKNVEKILAIELLCSYQAIKFRIGLSPAKALIPLQKYMELKIPKLTSDRMLDSEINFAIDIIKTEKIIKLITDKIK